MKKTKRVKIVTGLKCNIQCVFCYYRDNLKAPNRPSDEIRRDMLYAQRHGISEIDFSGGEPTVHPDLPSLIKEAKKIGMERICIISNGWRLSDINYMRSLLDAGLDEVLFSLHGSSEGIHEGLTATPGSFSRICKAISNASDVGLRVRTNTVVNRMNLEDLAEVSQFILPFRPVQVNFITINDWCYAKHLIDTLMVSYSEMSPKLKEACDILEPHVSAVNVRYIPFCFMQGYERFVCNHKQVPYDHYEWVPRVRARLEVQNNLLRYIGIIGYGFLVGGAAKNIGRVSLATVLDESVTESLRHWFYQKSPLCKQCSREKICDGVEKTYAKKFGLDELSPQPGMKISDPMFFRQ